jgi:Protein of unknown function (DUF3149)
MRPLTDLFTSAPGLMTVAGFGIMLGIGATFLVYLVRHVRADLPAVDKPRQ